MFPSLAKEIVEQKQVTEMDDGTRYIKILNGIHIRMTETFEEKDSLCCPNGACCPLFYKTVLDSLRISADLFKRLQNQLRQTKLYSFYKSGNAVLFIVDGFLDDSWGFYYSSRAQQPDTAYFRFGGYGVKFVDSLSPNWKRVAIN